MKLLTGLFLSILLALPAYADSPAVGWNTGGGGGLTAPVTAGQGGTGSTANTGATGTLLRGDGNSFEETPYTVPATVGSAGTLWRSNGTNLLTTTTTWADAYATGTIPIATGSNVISQSTVTYPNAVTLGNVLGVTAANAITSVDPYVLATNIAAARFTRRVYPSEPVGSATLLADYVATIQNASATNGNNDSTGGFTTFTTTAVNGALAGWNSGGAVTSYEQKPIYTMKIRTGASIANIRLWFCLTDNNSQVANQDAGINNNLMGFRYCPATDGTAFWRTVTCNNGGSVTATTTTQAIATNTTYTLTIDATSPSQVVFKINGVTVATHSTLLPSASADLQAIQYVTTLTTATRAFSFGGSELNLL